MSDVPYDVFTLLLVVSRMAVTLADVYAPDEDAGEKRRVVDIMDVGVRWGCALVGLMMLVARWKVD